MNKDTEAIHASLPTANDPNVLMKEALPYYSDDSNKTRYLSFRATGFSTNEARNLVGVDVRTVERWRQHDETFRHYDTDGITELRQQHAVNYQVAEYQRNFRNFMEVDRRILNHINTVLQRGGDMADLSQAEQQYLRHIRSLYGPQNLIAIMKAAAGDLNTGGTSYNFTQIIQDQARNSERAEAWGEVIDATSEK